MQAGSLYYKAHGVVMEGRCSDGLIGLERCFADPNLYRKSAGDWLGDGEWIDIGVFVDNCLCLAS